MNSVSWSDSYSEFHLAPQLVDPRVQQMEEQKVLMMDSKMVLMTAVQKGTALVVLLGYRWAAQLACSTGVQRGIP